MFSTFFGKSWLLKGEDNGTGEGEGSISDIRIRSSINSGITLISTFLHPNGSSYFLITLGIIGWPGFIIY